MDDYLPDIDIGVEPETVQLLKDIPVLQRAKLAVHTLNCLQPPADPFPPPQEEPYIRETVLAVSHPQAGNAAFKALQQSIYKYSRPAVAKLDLMLSELDEEIINSALRIREYTKNKLLELSNNPDPKVQIRALELLGKVKDVGLFSDKIEITHKSKSDSDLEQEIKQRLERFMGSADVVDAEVSDEAEKTDETDKTDRPSYLDYAKPETNLDEVFKARTKP